MDLYLPINYDHILLCEKIMLANLQKAIIKSGNKNFNLNQAECINKF